MGIGPANGDDSIFAVEGSVVDVGWTPEVPACWQITKLHHPGFTPNVIGLFTTVVLGNMVLLEAGSHAVKKGVGFGMQIVFKQFQHAARCNRGNNSVAWHPVDVFGGIDD